MVPAQHLNHIQDGEASASDRSAALRNLRRKSADTTSQTTMWESLKLLEPSVKVIPSATSWRVSPEYYRSKIGWAKPGNVSMAPAWYQQAHQVSHIIVHQTTLCKHYTDIKPIGGICTPHKTTLQKVAECNGGCLYYYWRNSECHVPRVI